MRVKVANCLDLYPPRILVMLYRAKNITIDKKLITIGESIKEVGSHQIVIRPHQDVEFTISLDVIAEGD